MQTWMIAAIILAFFNVIVIGWVIVKNRATTDEAKAKAEIAAWEQYF